MVNIPDAEFYLARMNPFDKKSVQTYHNACMLEGTQRPEKSAGEKARLEHTLRFTRNMLAWNQMMGVSEGRRALPPCNGMVAKHRDADCADMRAPYVSCVFAQFVHFICVFAFCVLHSLCVFAFLFVRFCTVYTSLQFFHSFDTLNVSACTNSSNISSEIASLKIRSSFCFLTKLRASYGSSAT